MPRQAAASIAPFFLSRWSGRAFSGDPLPDGALVSLLEAARWAPSSANSQPWRFVYAGRGTAAFRAFHDLLAPGNKPWCEKASALFVVASRSTRDDGRPARTHAFDTGAAWMSLALQAHLMGLVAHGMGGFDYEKAAHVIGLPEDHVIHCMVAVGCPGRREDLPEPYRGREEPSDRRPTSAFAFAERFPAWEATQT
jgi:nitroreductase